MFWFIIYCMLLWEGWGDGSELDDGGELNYDHSTLCHLSDGLRTNVTLIFPLGVELTGHVNKSADSVTFVIGYSESHDYGNQKNHPINATMVPSAVIDKMATLYPQVFTRFTVNTDYQIKQFAKNNHPVESFIQFRRLTPGAQTPFSNTENMSLIMGNYNSYLELVDNRIKCYNIPAPPYVCGQDGRPASDDLTPEDVVITRFYAKPTEENYYDFKGNYYYLIGHMAICTEATVELLDGDFMVYDTNGHQTLCQLSDGFRQNVTLQFQDLANTNNGVTFTGNLNKFTNKLTISAGFNRTETHTDQQHAITRYTIITDSQLDIMTNLYQDGVLTSFTIDTDYVIEQHSGPSSNPISYIAVKVITTAPFNDTNNLQLIMGNVSVATLALVNNDRFQCTESPLDDAQSRPLVCGVGSVPHYNETTDRVVITEFYGNPDHKADNKYTFRGTYYHLVGHMLLCQDSLANTTITEETTEEPATMPPTSTAGSTQPILQSSTAKITESFGHPSTPPSTPREETLEPSTHHGFTIKNTKSLEDSSTIKGSTEEAMAVTTEAHSITEDNVQLNQSTLPENITQITAMSELCQNVTFATGPGGQTTMISPDGQTIMNFTTTFSPSSESLQTTNETNVNLTTQTMTTLGTLVDCFNFTTEMQTTTSHPGGGGGGWVPGGHPGGGGNLDTNTKEPHTKETTTKASNWGTPGSIPAMTSNGAIGHASTPTLNPESTVEPDKDHTEASEGSMSTHEDETVQTKNNNNGVIPVTQPPSDSPLITGEADKLETTVKNISPDSPGEGQTTENQGHTSHTDVTMVGSVKPEEKTEEPIKPVNCRPMWDVEHADRHGSGTNPGATVNYTCHKGYVFTGGESINTLTCLTSGDWTDQPVGCQAILCPAFSATSGSVTSSTHAQKAMSNTWRSYQCRTGLHFAHFVRSWSTVCLSGGHWSAPHLPPCQERSCANMPASITHSSTSGYHIVSTSCMTSSHNVLLRYPDGRINKDVMCLHDNRWHDDDLQCQADRCPPVPLVTNTSLQLVENSEGGLAEFECTAGHRFPQGDKHRHIECRNHTWIPDHLPPCSTVTCPPILIENGSISTTVTLVDTTVTITCDGTFWLRHGQVAMTTTCLVNGSLSYWSPKPGNCEDIHCDKPIAPVNGTVTWTGLHGDDEAVYECQDGLLFLNGKKKEVLRCFESGDWDRNITDCKDDRCTYPPPVENTTVICENATIGASVTYTCISGHVFTGTTQTTDVICDPHTETWTGVPEACSPIYCPSLPEPLFGELSSPVTLVEDNVSITCDRGHVLPSGGKNVTLSCSLSQQWSWSNVTQHVCQSVVCPEPQRVPFFLDLQYNSTIYASTAVHHCPKGYRIKLKGQSGLTDYTSITTYCSEWQTWEPQVQKCSVVHCDAIATWLGILPNTTNTVFRTAVSYKCEDENGVLEYFNNTSLYTECDSEGLWNPPFVDCNSTFNASLGPPKEAPNAEDIGGFYIGFLSAMVIFIVLVDFATIIGWSIEARQKRALKAARMGPVNKGRKGTLLEEIALDSYYSGYEQMDLDRLITGGNVPLPAYYRYK